MSSKYKESQNNFNYKTINLLDFSDCKSVKILHYTIKVIVVNVAREFCRFNKKFCVALREYDTYNITPI